MLVTLMTDASWCPQTNLGGYGYWCTSSRSRVGGGSPIYTKSNNSYEAEFKGVVESLVECINRGAIAHGDCILVQLDCQGVVNALNGDGLTIKSPFGKEAYAYVEYLKEKYNLILQCKHVRGHTTSNDKRSVSNRICDARAREGLELARSRGRNAKTAYKPPKKKKQPYQHDRSSGFEKALMVRRRMQASRKYRIQG